MQTPPRIMNVAVRLVQHSERLGHLALSQTVSRPSSATRLRVNDIPPAAGIGRLSHFGSRRAGIGFDARRHRGRRFQRCRAAALPRTVRLGKAGLTGCGGVDMRENLAVDHRVPGVDVMLLDAEDLFQPAHQGLADLGHRGMPLPPGLHRGVPQGRLADARLVEHVEHLKIGTDVKSKTMVGNPAGHRDADRGDPRLSRENAGHTGAKRAGQVKFPEHEHDRCMQSVDVIADRQIKRFQRKCKISCELPRQVEYAAAAPIDPVNLDPE